MLIVKLFLSMRTYVDIKTTVTPTRVMKTTIPWTKVHSFSIYDIYLVLNFKIVHVGMPYKFSMDYKFLHWKPKISELISLFRSKPYWMDLRNENKRNKKRLIKCFSTISPILLRLREDFTKHDSMHPQFPIRRRICSPNISLCKL